MISVSAPNIKMLGKDTAILLPLEFREFGDGFFH